MQVFVPAKLVGQLQLVYFRQLYVTVNKNMQRQRLIFEDCIQKFHLKCEIAKHNFKPFSVSFNTFQFYIFDQTFHSRRISSCVKSPK